MKAAVLNSSKQVIWSVDTDATEIEVARAVTRGGDPVNVKKYRISHSKANVEKARKLNDASWLSRKEKDGRVFFLICWED